MKTKRFISEGDIALLLRRYNASTLLALLQEIANCGSSKLPWHSLVKSSNTGIKNAREYQALWRHLAYRIDIADSYEDDLQPMEDDSDLELEVEPSPGVSPEVAAEVAACVKVLAATGTPGAPSSKNSETYFAIDIPNSCSGWEVKGNGQPSNLIIQGAAATEIQPTRKKRKLWTPEEDQELIAAVEKCGEGNWAAILRGAFKHDRTAAQLSQRWALIRKRREGQTGLSQRNAVASDVHATGGGTAGSQTAVATGNLVLPGKTDLRRLPVNTAATTGSASGPSTTGNSCSTLAAVSTSSTLLPSQEQNSTRNQASPGGTIITSVTGKNRPPLKRVGFPGPQQGRSLAPSATMMGTPNTQGTTVGASEIRQAKTLPGTSVPLHIATSGPARYSISPGLRNSSVSSVGRGGLKSSTGPDPMIQAAAVAAGARIAPASAAASLLKAAQSGNVVHIGPGGVSMGKAGMTNQVGNSTVTSNMKAGSGAPGSRTSTGTYVHYVRTGAAPSSPYMLNSQRSAHIKNNMTRANSAQATQPVRPGAGITTSSLNSGQALALSPTQKVLPHASVTSPEVKSRVKLQNAVADSSGSVFPEGTGKSSISAEGNVALLSDISAKPRVLESASLSTGIPNPVMSVSTNLVLEDDSERKPVGQVEVPSSEPSVPLTSNESGREVLPGLLPVTTPGNAMPALGDAIPSAIASKSLTCKSKTEIRDDSVYSVITATTVQTIDVKPHNLGKLLPGDHASTKTAESTTSEDNMVGKTAISSVMDVDLPVDCGTAPKNVVVTESSAK